MERATVLRKQMRWLGTLFIVAGLIFAMTVQIARFTAADAQSIISSDPLTKAIYVSDRGTPVLDPVSVGNAQLRLAASSSELLKSVGDAEAIIFDPGAFAALDKVWLSDQLTIGRMIIVLNVPFTELQKVPGYSPIVTSGTYEDYTGTTYYSWLWQWSYQGKRYEVTGSDRFASTDAFLAHLKNQMWDLQSFRAQVTAPQQTPIPGSAPARPKP